MNRFHCGGMCRPDARYHPPRPSLPPATCTPQRRTASALASHASGGAFHRRAVCARPSVRTHCTLLDVYGVRRPLLSRIRPCGTRWPRGLRENGVRTSADRSVVGGCLGTSSRVSCRAMYLTGRHDAYRSSALWCSLCGRV